MTPDEIARRLEAAGVRALPPEAAGQFSKYLDLILRWNARMNLTSVRDPEEIVRRHFVECAFAAQKLPPGISTLLDFGSGAGFPGIPIAICRPEIQVTLAESQSKKAAFLAEAVRTLNLGGKVYGKRVEAMSGDHGFDAVTMRAVDKMATAISVARVYVKHYLVIFAGKDALNYRNLAPELLWNDPIQLPAGNQSVLLLGKRSL